MKLLTYIFFFFEKNKINIFLKYLFISPLILFFINIFLQENKKYLLFTSKIISLTMKCACVSDFYFHLALIILDFFANCDFFLEFCKISLIKINHIIKWSRRLPTASYAYNVGDNTSSLS
jgi:hypothetical protein